MSDDWGFVIYSSLPNAQYFSARGCPNGYAQYKCPMPNAPSHPD